jgi:hypothetical protein
VPDAKLNITRASFRRDDTWTEFKPNSASSAKISDRALTYLRYPFDDFQRDTGNAPLGASGFKAERMFNKGTRWLATGNHVASAAASALSNPDELPNSLFDIMRALSSSGKLLPPMEGREENTGWKRLGATQRQPRT